MLRRLDRLAFIGGAIGLTALAWVWLVLGAGMEMSAVEMTAMAGMDGWLMQPATWTPAYAALMASMWFVMMAAMMLPTTAPTVALYLKMTRDGEGRIGWRPAAFVAGYLAVWGGFSLAAAGLQWALETLRLLSPMLETTHAWLGAAILIAAGLWQLTPLKTACLRHCRSPLGFILGGWRPGAAGAFRLGIGHGAYCLGCCWALMALLFFGGVMNLYWIIGLALWTLAEKTLPFGLWLGRAAGVMLIGWGGWLALTHGMGG